MRNLGISEKSACISGNRVIPVLKLAGFKDGDQIAGIKDMYDSHKEDYEAKQKWLMDLVSN